jgi:hypothetical protein
LKNSSQEKVNLFNYTTKHSNSHNYFLNLSNFEFKFNSKYLIEFYDKFRGIDKENLPINNLPFGFKNDKFNQNTKNKKNCSEFSSFSMVKENRQSSDKVETEFWNYFKVTDFCGGKGKRMIDGRVWPKKVKL